ncbi:large neutral amino acids transporter small subunit 4-like isoform X2 [Antedon mediterranea]|uniref:large neutral amino acids transporter small subunit 4-like isoform X2 n=1 Tax=Antedon mediterranea TaxID=105859 RepID=UPI003AF60A95
MFRTYGDETLMDNENTTETSTYWENGTYIYTDYTTTTAASTPVTTMQSDIDIYVIGCREQDEKLNLAFTVGSFLLSGLTFPIGMVMDKIGCRYLRMVGSLMFAFSCILFGFADVETSSWLLFPAVAFNGVGGIITTFTSFQIANLFPAKRSTVISLNIGSYASAAILFMILKGLYDVGVSRQMMFLGVAVCTLFIPINCWINVPVEPIPDPEGNTGMNWHMLSFNHRISGKKFEKHVTTVGRRLSLDTDNVFLPPGKGFYSNVSSFDQPFGGQVKKEKDIEEIKLEMRNGKPHYSSQLHLEVKLEGDAKEGDKSFLKSVFSPIYMLSVLVLCIVQLRLLFFIGSISQLLERLVGDNTVVVNNYINVFGMMQLLCLLSSPVIGYVMDWKIKAALEQEKCDKRERRQSYDRRASTCSEKRGSVSHEKRASISKDKRGSVSSQRRVSLGFLRKFSTTSEDILYDGFNPPPSLKIRKLKNAAVAFAITTTLLMVFGVTVLIPNIVLQILSFLLHTVVRGFIHSAVCGLYAITYPANQIGSLVGLQSLVSACATLLQYPIFVAIEGPLESNPFVVNVGLFVITVLCYGLPIYMWWLARKLRSEQLDAELELGEPLMHQPTQSLSTVPEDV